MKKRLLSLMLVFAMVLGMVPMTALASDNEAAEPIGVFMTFAASEEYVEIQPQTLPSYERNGFTVVEWGGGECELIK